MALRYQFVLQSARGSAGGEASRLAAIRPDGGRLRSGPAGYLLDCDTDLAEVDRRVERGGAEQAVSLLGALYLAGETVARLRWNSS
jgi:hypothetical protein